jgi:hypothetical protein
MQVDLKKEYFKLKPEVTIIEDSFRFKDATADQINEYLISHGFEFSGQLKNDSAKETET